MTRYLLYFLTGFAIATFILFFRGYGEIPRSVYSDTALMGAMALFGVVSWVTLFKMRIGALLALMSLLSIAPWAVRLWQILPERDSALIPYIMSIHAVLSVLVLISVVVSARYTFGKHSWSSGTGTPSLGLKIILTLIPLAVVAAWFVVMNKI